MSEVVTDMATARTRGFGSVRAPDEIDWDAEEIDPAVYYQYRTAVETRRAATEQEHANDEQGDDSNATFENLGLEGDYASNYDPDTQDGSSAPSGGTISDTGTSDNWGDAGEDENDDLSQRSADSEMDDDLKSAFDRYANCDTPDY